MTKSRLFLSACFIASVLFFSSCDNDDRPFFADGGSGNIPTQIIEEFNAQFPGASNVVWTTKAGYAVVDFYWNGSRIGDALRNHTAWYALQSGILGMTEREIRLADLPEKVKAAFYASEYGQAPWVADNEVDVLTRDSASEILYVIDVEKKEGGVDTDVDLYYTSEGILVREVVDADNDKDYQEYLPQAPSNTVEGWLKEHYPDARIIDLDNENGGTEVEFIAGNLKHEAFFNRAQAWVYTKTEYRFRNIDEVKDIPSQVIAALKSTLEYLEGNNRVDEADKYETAQSGIFYCFELEGRFDNDIKIYISNDGTVLSGRPDLGANSSENTGTVAGDIDQFIQENYPGAVIIERDYDNGYLEVDIRHDGKEKELRFNGQNEWVRTSWEISIGELPSAVTNALSAGGYRLDDNEAEVIETTDSLWYEVEVRQNGGEFKVSVDGSGNIINVMRD